MPQYVQKNIGWLTIIVLCLLPVGRWLFIAPLNARFFDLASAATSLGQITGLLGMALFSLNLILASRLKFLDKIFFGLNRAYNHHHTIGAMAFSLLLFHPLLLAFKYVQFSLRSAALFFLPFTGAPAATYGIVALGLMIILLGVTFYLRIKYHYWKISHKFMTLAFAFALLHIIFIQSDISRDLFLKIYFLTLAFAGLALGSYRAWLYIFLSNDFTYRIENLNWYNSEVVEIELKPVGRAMKYQAGQFAFLRLKGTGLSQESHPFSLSSAPAEKNLKFLIKSLGDYTGELGSLRAGDLCLVAGPFGAFLYKKAASKNQIWLAGGIGLAPFLSMARDLSGHDYKVELYYSVKDRAEIVALEELEKLAATAGNFKIIPWYSEAQGRITGEKIAELSRGLEGKDIFICGPGAFMRSLRQQLMKLNVPEDKIHWEKFNLF